MTEEEMRTVEVLAATVAKREVQAAVAVLTERVANFGTSLGRIESGVLVTNQALQGEQGFSQRLRLLEESERTCPARKMWDEMTDRMEKGEQDHAVAKAERESVASLRERLVAAEKDLVAEKTARKSNSRWWMLIIGGTVLSAVIEKAKVVLATLGGSP